MQPTVAPPRLGRCGCLDMSFGESLMVAVLAIVLGTAFLALSKAIWRVLRPRLPKAWRFARGSRPVIASSRFMRNLIARRVVERIEARRKSMPELSVESISEYKIKFPGHHLNDEIVPNGVARLTLRVQGEMNLGRPVQIEWREGANGGAPIGRAWSALEYDVPRALVTKLDVLDDGSIGVVVDSWQPGHWSGDPIPDNPPPVRFRYWASVEFRIRVLSELDTIGRDRHPQAGVRAAFRFYRSVSEYGTPWTGWIPARFAPEAGDDVMIEQRS